MSRGQFFAVDRQHFEKACDLGLHPALAYLVIAAGTLRDMRTSAWSADAVRRYCRSRWDWAHDAIEILQRRRLLTRDRKSASTRPRYLLGVLKDPVWLPNALVTGAAQEDPGVAWLRREDNVDALRLLVRLYAVHDLHQAGGIPTNVMFLPYQRAKIIERGPHVFWGFNLGHHQYYPRASVFKRFNESRTLDAMAALDRVGLVYYVPWVFDAPHISSGCPVFPVDGDSGQIVYDAISDWVASLSEAPGLQTVLDDYDYVIPMERSFSKIDLVGVAQLRYLPRGNYTLQAVHDRHQNCLQHAAVYRALAEGVPLHEIKKQASGRHQ